MPTIRELVGALAQRDGVEGVILLGRDGLVIDGRTSAPLDAELLAAMQRCGVPLADFAT